MRCSCRPKWHAPPALSDTKKQKQWQALMFPDLAAQQSTTFCANHDQRGLFMRSGCRAEGQAAAAQ
jgi:hypothetical protein